MDRKVAGCATSCPSERRAWVARAAPWPASLCMTIRAASPRRPHQATGCISVKARTFRNTTQAIEPLRAYGILSPTGTHPTLQHPAAASGALALLTRRHHARSAAARQTITVRRYRFTNIPYSVDLGASCGANFVSNFGRRLLPSSAATNSVPIPSPTIILGRDGSHTGSSSPDRRTVD